MKVEVVEVSKLAPAPWNYKKPATEAEIDRLIASIQRDRSAGVLAVRELGKRLEVIDGNHRLTAIQKMGWTHAPVENFGRIGKPEAILIAQRRNHQWFEDDMAALSALFKVDVLPNFTLDELETFMPLNRQQMESMAKLTEFNWDELPERGETLSFMMTEEIRELWAEWYPIAVTKIGDGTSKTDALAHALRAALAAAKLEAS